LYIKGNRGSSSLAHKPWLRLEVDNHMGTRLLMEIKNLLADLAATLITGKKKDAAQLALALSEKSKALAEELVSSNT
jgi:hypothetical protein